MSTRQQGVTLIEVIVALVIFSIAMTVIFGIVAETSRRSSDPILQTQALHIAQSYLDEVLALSPTTASCPITVDKIASRESWQTVDCYNGVNHEPPRDRSGNPLTGNLAAYLVRVSRMPMGTGCLFNTTQLTQITVRVERDNWVYLALTACN